MVYTPCQERRIRKIERVRKRFEEMDKSGSITQVYNLLAEEFEVSPSSIIRYIYGEPRKRKKRKKKAKSSKLNAK